MAPTFVQSASGTATAGTTITVTLSSPTTAGNCLIVKVGTFESTAAPTVSGITLGGSAGNFADAKNISTGTVFCDIWTDQNCAGGQTSVVVTLTGGAGSFPCYAAVVEEWSGVQTASAVDTVNGGASSGTTFSSGSSGTLAQPNEVVVGAAYVESSTITGPGAPWTELSAVVVTNSIINCALQCGYQVVSATTAQTYSGTNGSGPWASVIVSLKGSSATAPGAPPVNPGLTWKRRFQRGSLHVFPPQPAIGSIPPPYSPPAQPVTAGRAWVRRFQPELLHAFPRQPSQPVTCSGSVALAPMALSGVAQPVQPYPPQRPGMAWIRRFRRVHLHVQPPQPSQPVTLAGQMAMAPMAVSGAGTESQPVVPARPGRTWKRRFQPESLRVTPPQPSQPVTATGSVALVPMTLSGSATEVFVVPPQRPGLTWRRFHRLGQMRPPQPSQPVTMAGSVAMAPMSAVGFTPLSTPKVRADPGRTWRRFHRLGRMQPPQPSQPVTSAGSLALAPMAVSGTAVEVQPYPPQRPGLTWRRIYRLGRMRPPQPSQPVTAAGSVAMAPMVLSGAAAGIFIYPPQRPGATWRRHFRLGRQRPPQPSQGIIVSGSAAMAPMAASASAQQLIAALPPQRPGLTWRRFHRLGRQVPPQPSQPVTSSGSLALAPLAIRGIAAEIIIVPPQRPGLTWRRWFRQGRQHPLQPSQPVVVAGSLALAPVRILAGPTAETAHFSGGIALAPMVVSNSYVAVNPTIWRGAGFLAIRAATGPNLASLWAAYMQAQQVAQTAENNLREAQLAGGTGMYMGQYFAAFNTASNAARQAYLNWASASEQWSRDFDLFAAYGSGPSNPPVFPPAP